jgi:hypothetical protein
MIDALRSRMVHHAKGLELIDFTAKSGGAKSNLAQTDFRGGS